MQGDGDGWVVCAQGHRHWGRHGAAGVLIRDRRTGDRVILQHRAAWSHQGDTWGVPGGARDSHESAVEAALRETQEEAGLVPATVHPYAQVADDHGGWSYVTVLAEPAAPLDPRPIGGESETVRWVDVAEVDVLRLHPGFAASWPRLRDAPAGLHLVVDGANVVGAGGAREQWWRDRAGAARRLRDRLAGFAAAGLAAADAPVDLHGPDLVYPRVTLVVEGAAKAVAADRPDPPSLDGDGLAPPGAVRVVAAPGSGDDAIVAVAAAVGRLDPAAPCVVVTADRELRHRTSSVRAVSVGPTWLLSHLGT